MDTEPFDVYPSLSTKVTHLPRHLHADRLVYSPRLLPFEISLAEDTVHYTSLPLQSRNYSQHVHYLVQSFYKDCSVKRFSWQKMDEHLRRSQCIRKNVNNRTCFLYKDHTFLTKAGFTSGLRCVDAQTVHLLQIGYHPLFLYYVEASRAETAVFSKTLRGFAMDDEPQFARVKLQGYTNYTLPAGTYYVLNSACKTYFSLHIVSQETVVDFPVQFLGDLEAYKPYERFSTPRASLRTRLSQSVEGELPATSRMEEVPSFHRNASAPASTDEVPIVQNPTLPENPPPVLASGDLSFQGTYPTQTTVYYGGVYPAAYTSLFSLPVQEIPRAAEATVLPSADNTGMLEDPPTNLSIFLDPLSPGISETNRTELTCPAIPETNLTEPASPMISETDQTEPASPVILEDAMDQTSFELPVETVYGSTSLQTPSYQPAEFNFSNSMTPLPRRMDYSLNDAPHSIHTRKTFIKWYHHLKANIYGRPVEKDFQKSTESDRALDLREATQEQTHFYGELLGGFKHQVREEVLKPKMETRSIESSS